MGEILKWLQRLIPGLMPKQDSSGDGAVQMGHVKGNVQNVTQVHQHFYAAAPVAGPSATPPKVQPNPSPASAGPITDGHKEVLSLMDPLPTKNRQDVLKFMKREFKTTMVIELQPNQVYRAKMYISKVRESVGIGRSI